MVLISARSGGWTPGTLGLEFTLGSCLRIVLAKNALQYDSNQNWREGMEG
jgi:hypothetical protein